MKKIISYLFAILLFASIIPQNVHAEGNCSKEALFLGDIFQGRDFYLGEYLKNNDFKIDGDFFDKESHEKIPTSDWRIFAFEAVQQDYVNIIVKYVPDLDKDIPRYKDILYTVYFNSKEFNPNLEIKSNKTIRTSETNLVSIFFKNEIKFKNSIGQNISGKFKYKNVKLKSGTNIVKYTFKPYGVLITDKGYESYNIKSGNIKIIVE